MLYKITNAYIALLLTVFLLAFPREGYVAISEFMYFLFLLLCGGYVITIFFLRIASILTNTQQDINYNVINIPTTNKLLILFIIFTLLSTVFSPYTGTLIGDFRSEGALTITIYVLSCLFIAMYFKPRKWMVFLLGGALMPACLIAYIQLTGANPFTLYPVGHNFYGSGIYYSGVFLSTMGNAGLFSAFLSLAVGIVIMALIKLDIKGLWFLSVPLFLSALLIFIMSIDAAVVALLTGFVLMLPVAITCRKTFGKTLVVLAILLLAFVISQIVIF